MLVSLVNILEFGLVFVHHSYWSTIFTPEYIIKTGIHVHMFKFVLEYDVIDRMSVYLKYIADINLIRFSVVLYAIKPKPIKPSRVLCVRWLGGWHSFSEEWHCEVSLSQLLSSATARNERRLSVTASQSELLDTKFDFCTIFMTLNTFPYPFKNHLFLAHGHTKT